jgi:hypothetical protein
MKQKLSIIAFLCLLVISLNRCKQSALELDNPNRPTETSYYSTESEFIAASNAMYATFQKLQLYASHLEYGYDLRGDEYDSSYKTANDPPLNELKTFNILSDNSYVFGYWRYLYEGVYRANILIDKLTPFNLPNATRKNRMLGEAKFLRGFAYYHLVNNFGDVPLFTNSADQRKLNPSRAPKAEVINQIIADWKDAKAALPTPAEWGNADLGRATKGAAQAFLGKMYMMLGRYAEAKAELGEVVNSGVYDLAGIDYLSNFELSGENNRESIF